ncbi:MAG: TMEM175 family protein [Bryobacterales bacterium]
MKTSRLEAFSDGVIAILITIMVLEMKAPHGSDLEALRPMLPIFLVYVMSFIYLGIYWNNHHHLLHAASRVNGKILWANLFLLFWLSLIPLVTAWMGENHFAVVPTAVYGVILFMSGVAYLVLQAAILGEEPKHSKLREAVGKDVKGKVSLASYAIAVAAACLFPELALAIYVGVALMWLIPDRRIETLSQG